jgi:hypothetical protein
MAQHDFNIANATFPAVRSDINSALTAINTTQSGTSRPSSAVAGTIWLDTTSATTPTLKYYDGADDISLATLDHSANTVNWLDSSVSITGLSTTATGTVLTLSDTANTSTVNLIIDNQKEIRFRETTANGTNYVGFKAPASITSDKIWTLPSADGTAGQFLKTDGSGNLSFETIAVTPEQLVKSMPLQSGVSLTAGRGVFINSSGEVSAYPTLNTLGTEYTNSNATAYTAISNDGSRAIKISTSGTYTFTVTYTGVALSGTASPTNGTTTVTSSVSPPNNTTNYSSVIIYPISNTEFYVSHGAGNGFVNTSTNSGINTKNFVITVDSSGNCTKGSEVNINSSNPSGGGGNSSGHVISKIKDDVYAFNAFAMTDYTYTNTLRTITISGTTVTATTDAEAITFAPTSNIPLATGFNSVFTTSSIIGVGSGNNWITASYTSGNIGTVTTTSTISDANTTPVWFRITDARVLVYYQDTSLLYKLRTYDVNQTTGALTLVDTEFLTGYAWASSSGNFRFKNSTSGVFKYLISGFYYINSISLDSSGNITGFNLGSKLDTGDLTPVYNTSDDFFINYFTTAPKLKKYTVGAYSTSSPNYLGFAKETDSTTPVNIVTDGVIGGLSGLTSGTLYYISTDYNGTVSTDSTSGILVGKAISATEILLQRTNTQ